MHSSTWKSVWLAVQNYLCLQIQKFKWMLMWWEDILQFVLMPWATSWSKKCWTSWHLLIFKISPSDNSTPPNLFLSLGMKVIFYSFHCLLEGAVTHQLTRSHCIELDEFWLLMALSWPNTMIAFSTDIALTLIIQPNLGLFWLAVIGMFMIIHIELYQINTRFWKHYPAFKVVLSTSNSVCCFAFLTWLPVHSTHLLNLGAILVIYSVINCAHCCISPVSHVFCHIRTPLDHHI